MPLGAGLRLGGWPWLRVLGFAFALSLAIELLQLTVITGRDASLSDLITNTTGAAAAAALVQHRLALLFPARRAAAGYLAAWAVVWLGTLALSAWLQMPRELEGPLTSGWPAPGASPAMFNGRVSSAAVNGMPVPRMRKLPGAEAIRDSLALGRATLDIDALSGTPTPDLAWLYAVQGEGDPVLVLYQVGRDAVLGVPGRGQQLRVWPPTLQLADAFPPTAGVPVALRGAMRDGKLWLASSWGGHGRQTTTTLGPTRGWQAVLPWKFSWGQPVGLFTGLWIAGLALPLGYWAASLGRPILGIAAAAALLGVGLGAVPTLTGFPPVQWWEWSAGALGAAGGWALRPIAKYLQQRCASPSTSGSCSS